MKVLILGASQNQERYSYKALHMLQEYGHQVFPINPALEQIEGAPVFKDLTTAAKATSSDAKTANQTEAYQVDTLTLYVNPQVLEQKKDEILSIKPRRIIMNPGTEHDELAAEFRKHGIDVVYGCTLVMLRTNQF